MARPLEPITAAKALEALADNSRSTHPAERLIIPVIPRDSTMGPIPHVEAQALMRGMDWENNCMILTPAQPLTVLTPDEGNGYVYQIGTGLTLPKRLDVCIPGGVWTAWDGFSPIPVVSGQQIMIVEINGEYGAERAGTVTV